MKTMAKQRNVFYRGMLLAGSVFPAVQEKRANMFYELGNRELNYRTDRAKLVFLKASQIFDKVDERRNQCGDNKVVKLLEDKIRVLQGQYSELKNKGDYWAAAGKKRDIALISIIQGFVQENRKNLTINDLLKAARYYEDASQRCKEEVEIYEKSGSWFMVAIGERRYAKTLLEAARIYEKAGENEHALKMLDSARNAFWFESKTYEKIRAHNHALNAKELMHKMEEKIMELKKRLEQPGNSLG